MRNHNQFLLSIVSYPFYLFGEFAEVLNLTGKSDAYKKLGNLSTRGFETRTATGREHFACQESIVSQIFVLLISNGEKILSNVNVVVCGQVNNENCSLPVAVRVSKLRVLKLPNLHSGARALSCPSRCQKLDKIFFAEICCNSFRQRYMATNIVFVCFFNIGRIYTGKIN